MILFIVHFRIMFNLASWVNVIVTFGEMCWFRTVMFSLVRPALLRGMLIDIGISFAEGELSECRSWNVETRKSGWIG